jgi:hypothetical protein
MEELIVIVLQFLLEFIFEILINLPFDWPRKSRMTPEKEKTIGKSFVMFCIGCGLAWLSAIVFPRTFIHHPALRIANLLLAPVAAAYISRTIAEHTAEANANIRPRNHFWQAFWFTLGFVAVRFAYANH